IGVKGAFPSDAGVIGRKIKQGAGNIASGPAMTIEEAIGSLVVGIEIAEAEIRKGARILGTGEMGIGNTTPSTAILSVLGDIAPEEITGNGAGVGNGGLAQKVKVIKTA